MVSLAELGKQHASPKLSADSCTAVQGRSRRATYEYHSSALIRMPRRANKPIKSGKHLLNCNLLANRESGLII